VDSAGRELQQEPLAVSAIDLTTSRLLETRLLVRRETGWTAFPYVWNDSQTEAFLRVAGASASINLQSEDGTRHFTYFVPNENQWTGWHVTDHPDGDMHPLAATGEQLQTRFDPADLTSKLQLESLRMRGWLQQTTDTAPTISWLDSGGNIEARASAYLRIHCGHCHNPNGAADTSALILDGSPTSPTGLGVCKPPVAAGGGAGDRLYAIVPGAPERSILLYRMQSTAPDEMMPELGRSLVHTEGVELIQRWIANMSGGCDTTGANL